MTWRIVNAQLQRPEQLSLTLGRAVQQQFLWEPDPRPCPRKDAGLDPPKI